TYSHAYQTVINYKNMAVNKVYRQLRTLNIDNSFPKIKLISLLKCINILNQTFNKRLFLSRFIDIRNFLINFEKEYKKQKD
ncbi:hypothetical protein, partial [Acinetobacter baumannii]